MKDYITRIKYGVHRFFELGRLHRKKASHKSPQLPKLLDIEDDFLMWTIDIPGQKKRYMRWRRFEFENDDYVVLVDSVLFYEAWLKSSALFPVPHLHECVGRKHMPLDKKYRSVSYSRGSDYSEAPTVRCTRLTNGEYRISFVDGITRTFWLIVNECPAFPVRLNSAVDAENLFRVAGLGEQPYQINEYIKAQKAILKNDRI